MRLLPLFLTLALTIGTNVDAGYSKVKLTEVQSLVLKPGMMTTARRSSAVPQLKCIRNCKHAADIETVFCKNVGNDGIDVNWECTAKPQLPAGVKLGDLEVVCEGYHNPDDPYILAGSCGLEYSLVGSSSQQHTHESHAYNYDSHRSAKPYRSSSSDHDGWSWFTWIILALVAYTIYRSCTSSSRHAAADIRRNGGGGGGHAGNPPPPPYSQAAAPGGAGPSPQSGYGYTPTDTGYSGASAGAGSGPGFWSGMAGGGLMGYMLGNRGHSNTYGYSNSYMQPPQSSFFNSGYGSGFGSGFGSSGYGGGSSFGGGRSSPAASAGDSTSYATTRRR